MMDAGFSISQAPYPGLRSFSRSEFDIFFGRDDHTQEMVSTLEAHHFLCVTGPSGCGKSSLARTGLFNALEAGFMRGRGSDWIFCDLYPETDPLGRLAASLAKAIVMGESGRDTPEPDADQAEDIAELCQLFTNHVESHSSDLTPALDKVTAVAGRPIVILIDQFEEIFRYAQDDPHAASRFVDVLLKTAAQRKDIYVVITIRTDELEKCARYSGLTGAINQAQFLAPTLDRFEMQEAIEGPITMFGGQIDPELTVWMLNGLEEQLDKLPLMQHALRLLYLNVRSKTPEGPVRITLADFHEVFGTGARDGKARNTSHIALRSSLSNRLEALYRGLEQPDRAIARGLFCALTTLESRGRDIRRPLSLGEASRTLGCSFDRLMRVVSAFRGSPETYLRIAGEDDGIHERDIVDVTHECILRLWAPLQQKWLPAEQAAAENLRFLARLARDRGEDRRTGFWDRALGLGLLKGNALDRYTDWWAAKKPNAAWADRYLVGFEWHTGGGRALSREEIFRQIDSYVRESRVSAQRTRWLAAAALVCALGSGLFWVQQRNAAQIAQQRADAEEQIRQTERAAEIAQLNLRVQEGERTEVWAKISAVNPGPLSEAPVAVAEAAADALESALEFDLPEDAQMQAQQKLLSAVGYIHERARFALGTGSDDQVMRAAYMPDGRRFVTLDQGLDLRIWDPNQQGSALSRVSLAGAFADPALRRARSLAVAPDGTMAVGTQRGAVLLVEGIETPSGAAPDTTMLFAGPTRAERESVMGLRFSADGSVLIAATLTGYIHVWRRGADGGWRASGVLSGQSLQQRDLGVPRDESPRDGSIALDKSYAVWDVDLAPDGQLAAAGFENGAVCLFSLDGARVTCDREGHKSTAKSVRFAPDGALLATGGNDDAVRLWGISVPGGAPRLDLSPVVLWHDTDVWDLDFSDDGRFLASATWGREIRLYDTESWREVQTMRGHGLSLRSVEISPDATEVLSGALDKTARIWTPFVNRAVDSSLSGRLGPQITARNLSSVAMGQGAGWIATSNRRAVWLKTPDAPLIAILSEGQLRGAEITALAAPGGQDLLLASLSTPEVLVWTPGADGGAALRRIALDSGLGDADLIGRHLAVTRDGTRFAVDVRSPDGLRILICRTDANPCGTAPESHLVMIPFVPHVPPRRETPQECNRPGTPRALALSDDGRWLAAGGDDCKLRLYALDDTTGTAKLAGVMADHVGNITAVDFATDNTTLMTASTDWQMRTWRLGEDSSEIYSGHKAAVRDAGFLPDGLRFASGSSDEKLYLWEQGARQPVLDAPGFSETINAVDSKQGPERIMAVGSTNDGAIVTQPMVRNAQEALDLAREVIARIVGPES